MARGHGEPRGVHLPVRLRVDGCVRSRQPGRPGCPARQRAGERPPPRRTTTAAGAAPASCRQQRRRTRDIPTTPTPRRRRPSAQRCGGPCRPCAASCPRPSDAGGRPAPTRSPRPGRPQVRSRVPPGGRRRVLLQRRPRLPRLLQLPTTPCPRVCGHEAEGARCAISGPAQPIWASSHRRCQRHGGTGRRRPQGRSSTPVPTVTGNPTRPLPVAVCDATGSGATKGTSCAQTVPSAGSSPPIR